MVIKWVVREDLTKKVSQELKMGRGKLHGGRVFQAKGIANVKPCGEIMPSACKNQQGLWKVDKSEQLGKVEGKVRTVTAGQTP